MQDDTEETRRQADEDLKAREKLFHSLASMAPAGIYLTDPAGRCTFVNQRWIEMAGLTEAEALGDGWIRGLHPDDRVAVAAAWKHMVESEGHWSLDYRFQAPDGKITWVQAVASPRRNAAGTITGYIGVNLDISARKQVEAALHASDKVFRHAVDMLCVAGFDGFFKVLNPSWSRVLGWSTEELLAKPWLEFVHPDDREATVNARSTLVNGREIYQFENRYICKDGSLRWLSWSSFPYPAEAVMFGVARDVTRQKRIEAALRESEQRFHALVESAPDAVFIQTGGRFAYVNQACIRMLGGASAGDMLDQPVTDRFHPDFREAVKARIRALNEEGRAVPAIEEVMLTLQGEPVPVEVSAVPFVYGGQHGALVFVHNITARKAAEHDLQYERDLLHALLDSMPDAIYFKDAQSRFLRVNRAQAARFGLDNPALVEGRTDANYFSPDHAARARADECEIMSRGTPIIGKEEQETWPDGRTTWVSTTKVPLRDSRGHIVGTLGMSRDITEHKQSELQLEARLEELRRWHEATLGREMRVLELKREINALLAQAGQPPRYASAVEEPGRPGEDRA